LKNASDAGIKRAAVFYQRKLIEKVSKPNSGRRVRRVGGKGSYTIYPNPSKPGEAPKLRTGFGRRNIVVNHGDGYSRIGVTANAKYMIYLELGTRRIARRPWLIRTLVENKEVIGALAVAGE
jgi:hypothetical protein